MRVCLTIDTKSKIGDGWLEITGRASQSSTIKRNIQYRVFSREGERETQIEMCQQIAPVTVSSIGRSSPFAMLIIQTLLAVPTKGGLLVYFSSELLNEITPI